MPDNDTGPEKFSVDEMMRSLREREGIAEEGEVVIRKDGSRAVKVRKRKRRTSQRDTSKGKMNRRSQLFHIAVIVVTFALIGLGGMCLLFYANSPMFRQRMVDKIESTSGAEVSIQQPRINATTVRAAAMDLEWATPRVLAMIQAYEISAGLHPETFLGQKLRGEEVVAKSAVVSLSANEAVASGQTQRPKLDSLVQFGRYSSPVVTLQLGENGSAGSLVGVEASLFSGASSKLSEIRLSRGILSVSGWPEFELDRGSATLKEGEVNVKYLRFRRPVDDVKRSIELGSLELSGRIDLDDPSGESILRVVVAEFPLRYLLGSGFGVLFEGNVESADREDSNTLTFRPAKGNEAKLELELSADSREGIYLKGFEFLDYFARGLDDTWYKSPSFTTEKSLKFQRVGTAVTLSNIHLEQKGRLIIQGNLKTLEAGQIEGTFRVGLPSSIVSAGPNPLFKMPFQEKRNGYSWVTLRIGGTAAKPLDNFAEIYAKALPSDPNDREALGD